MSLGKDFRLPLDVRPVRYRAHLALDLAAGSFEGRGEIELQLAAPRREVQLHALSLDLVKARARLPGGRTLAAAWIEADAESQTVKLAFPEDLPAGSLLLDVAWTGKFTPGLRGLYRAGPTAVTQFEAADARRVFPCFDEPAFKARWSITLLGVPAGAAALSNGPIVEDVPLLGSQGDSSSGQPGSRQVTFAETPLLSSYLVALCVGDLVASEAATVRGVPIRTWSLPQKRHLTAFAQACAGAVLPLLEDYFGQPYAYGKLDQVGVPDFEAGAMENAGCITFREVALLLDPATASLPLQKRVAEVITHELAHQWFGNLVTMVWWDDLWLNEAFATWMAYKIVDAWRPEWRLWMDFEVGKGAALALDALQSSHPIRAEVKNAEEAGESFDLITYEKGGAMLRMIEAWLGKGPFRDGIRLYMRRFREKNAVADDLWSALAEASGQPILQLANSWIRQTGFPLVEATEQGGRLRLRQRRFYSDPDAREEAPAARWLVPVVLRMGGAGGVREQRLLLDGEDAELEIPLADGAANSWLLANAGARGFFRVLYEPRLLARLVGALGQLLPEERLALVSDQWALVRAGKAATAGFLDLLDGLGGERDYVALDEVVARLSWLEHRAVADADRPRIAAWIERSFAGQLAELGWGPVVGEPDGVRLRRSSVLRALALVARAPTAVAAAVERFEALLGAQPESVDPNLRDTVVAVGARTADAARFERLQARAASEVDPAARRRFLHALALVEKPSLVERAVGLVLTDAVQLQDTASYVGALLGNRAARDQAFELLQTKWPEVRRKADSPMLLRRVVEALGALPERRHLLAVEAFLAEHPIEGARQAVAQTLERLRLDVGLRERVQPELAAWLTARGF